MSCLSFGYQNSVKPQTNKKTNRQTHGCGGTINHIKRQTNRQMRTKNQTYRQIWTNNQINLQIWTNNQTNKQTYKHTDRQSLQILIQIDEF